jgi:hypothetical protein
MSAEGWLRRGLGVAAAVATLLLAWPVWTWMRADRVALSNPDAAIALAPAHPQALEQAAAVALDRGDWAAAESAARAALSARPLEDRPYRILAAVFEATGRDADALAAHRAAVTMSPRNAPSRLWLATRDLGQGRYADALVHIDWALRADRTTAGTVFPALLAGLDIAPFRAAVLDLLRTNPPWRAGFVTHVANNARSVDLALPLFDALAATGPLPAAEQTPWVARLEREQRWAEFNRYLGRTGDAAPVADLLVDGEFERQPSGIGRDWRIGRIPGATITLSGNSGRRDGGRALTIEFANQRVPFDHVRQLLQLAPGRYVVAGEARLDSLRAARGLRWTMSCQSGTALGSSEPFVGHQGWSPWTFEVEVPAEACGAQWLALRLDAVGPSEQLVSGTARFDAISVASQ